MIDLTLACEVAYLKLVDVVTVADAEDHAGNSFLIGELVIKLNFCSDFEHKGWSRFRS